MLHAVEAAEANAPPNAYDEFGNVDGQGQPDGVLIEVTSDENPDDGGDELNCEPADSGRTVSRR